MFPYGAYFSGVFDEIFIEVPYFHKTPPPLTLKNFWLCSCTQALFFLQNALSEMFDSVLNTFVLITA